MTFLRYASLVVERYPLALDALIFRTLPFAGYALLARRARWRFRIALAATCAGVVFAACRLQPAFVGQLVCLPVVFVYFAFCAVVVHWLRGLLSWQIVRTGGLLLIAAMLFVVVPAITVKNTAVAAMLVVGWEATLSSHSYGIDTRGKHPTLRDGLMFLLVNPTLVYAERGVRLGDPRFEWCSILRVLRGAVTILGRQAVLLAVAYLPSMRVLELGDISGPLTYAAFARSQLFLLLGLYCAHSGLASIQIGWMRILGYRIPERYRYPFLAVSPRDFWNRWNTWVGRWAQLYIYAPLTRRAIRRWPGPAGAFATAIATFAAIGVLHDFGVWALRANTTGRCAMSLKFTMIFVLIGTSFSIWQAGLRVAQRYRPIRAPRFVVTAISWMVCLQLICLVAWLAIPVLRNNSWPPAVERALARFASDGLIRG